MINDKENELIKLRYQLDCIKTELKINQTHKSFKNILSIFEIGTFVVSFLLLKGKLPINVLLLLISAPAISINILAAYFLGTRNNISKIKKQLLLDIKNKEKEIAECEKEPNYIKSKTKSINNSNIKYINNKSNNSSDNKDIIYKDADERIKGNIINFNKNK